MTLFGQDFRELLRAVVRNVRRPRPQANEGDRTRRRRNSASGTFTGHRAYAQGEDLRSLDWNVYARTGELFVKLLEEDQRRALNVLLDTSPSMTAGMPARFDGARRLVALLGGVALARLDCLNLVSASGGVLSLEGVKGIEPMLDHLEGLAPRGSDASEPVRAWAMRALRGRIAWVSDFAAPTEVERGLRLLGRARRDAFGLLPTIVEDDLPAIDGYLALRDPETEQVVRLRVDVRLRAAIETELRNLRRRQDAVFRQAGVPLVRQRVPAPDVYRVRAWTDGAWPAWI